MSDRDYYEILGVARDADAAALKSAYRKMAKQLHPDCETGDEAKFKELNEAYSILSDAEKRAAYDRFGKAAFQNGGGGPGGDPFDMFNEVFGDVFGDLFGAGGGRQRARSGPQRGADLRYDMEISLEEAFAGVSKRVTLPVAVACEDCKGSGAAAGSKPETCVGCGGAGQVRAQQGFFSMTRTCPQCGGRGQTIKDPCKPCGGRGMVRQERSLDVQIPAGVEDGTRIRLSNEGEAGPRGGPRGDLYIFLSIAPHSVFERDGPDLYCRATVPMTTAALGGEIEIPTIEGGRAKVKVPEGAQTGRRLRLGGKGMSRLRSSSRGDLHVEIFVEVPVHLSAKQRKLLQEFSETCCSKSHPQSFGFLDRVKRMFEGDERPNA